ncbi:hypothetical protein ACK8HY_10150 [Sphingobacterium sp. NGMCC 1.201703]
MNQSILFIDMRIDPQQFLVSREIKSWFEPLGINNRNDKKQTAK